MFLTQVSISIKCSDTFNVLESALQSQFPSNFQTHDVWNSSLPGWFSKTSSSTEHLLHSHPDGQRAGGPVQGDQREHGSGDLGRPGNGPGWNQMRR